MDNKSQSIKKHVPRLEEQTAVIPYGVERMEKSVTAFF